MAGKELALALITLFFLVDGATAHSALKKDTPAAAMAMAMPPWVQPRERKLLGLKVRGTLVDTVVAKDKSGQHTNISAAVAGAPQGGRKRYVIYIKRGTYAEFVEIRRKNVMLIGDGMGQTVITGARNMMSHYIMPCTATVSAQAPGFMARDLTIENTAGPGVKQAVALLSNSQHSVCYRCELRGFQDTLYAENHVQFYRDCDISGTIDFVFGDAKAVFQNCRLLVRRPVKGSHNVVTAQGRDKPDQDSGFSFQNCSVTAHEDLTGVETYLGRPWGNHSHVVFMQSFLSDIVHPHGWVHWDKAVHIEETTLTVFYGEYENTGPGADVSQRVNWPGFHATMDAAQATMYTVQRFINGTQWLPGGVKYKAGL